MGMLLVAGERIESLLPHHPLITRRPYTIYNQNKPTWNLLVGGSLGGKEGYPSNLYLPARNLREGRSALGVFGYRESSYQVECHVGHVTGTQLHVSIAKAEQVEVKQER